MSKRWALSSNFYNNYEISKKAYCKENDLQINKFNKDMEYHIGKIIAACLLEYTHFSATEIDVKKGEEIVLFGGLEEFKLNVLAKIKRINNPIVSLEDIGKITERVLINNQDTTNGKKYLEKILFSSKGYKILNLMKNGLTTWAINFEILDVEISIQ